MAQPEIKDGDGDDGSDELDVELIPDNPPQFYWASEIDEIRRSFILDRLGDPSIDARILVENMELIFKWLTTGEIPKPKKSHLKVAES